MFTMVKLKSYKKKRAIGPYYLYSNLSSVVY